MPRRLKIDLSELEEAFEFTHDTISWYLNLETGSVLMVNEDLLEEVEQLSESAVEQGIEFEQAVRDSDLPDLEKQDLIDAANLDANLGVSFIEVPEDESRDGYRDMRDFTSTVRSARLRELLEFALEGPRPFRRFKDALKRDAVEEERWYKYENDRLRERIRDWLESEDIEPIED
jgi:hypothetical protein